MSAGHSHRPTLKQSNKPFKSKHATKSSLKDAAKGRIESRQSPKSSSTNTSAQNAAALRLNRRNTAKQHQAHKRDSIVSATRVFNGVDGAPRIVAVVPLSDDPSLDALGTVKMLVQALDEEMPDDAGANGLYRIRASRFKTSLQFIPLPYRSLYQTLDACKAADYVLFLLSPTIEVDQWGDTLLRILQAQGMPQVVSLVLPLPPNANRNKSDKPGIIKSLLSFMQYFVPSQMRVYDLDSNSDRVQAMRALCEGKPADVKWREGRTWILAEETGWVDEELTVTGVVRGSWLSADRLVHLQNLGDFQISKIMSAPLPRPTRAGSVAAMQIEPEILGEPDAETADSLVSSNDPDDMANEQTWPTEDEMNGDSISADATNDSIPDAVNGTTPKRIKKIPKGTSEYQAAWILDDDDDGEEHEDEGVDVGDPSSDANEMAQDDNMEMQDVDVHDDEEDEVQMDVGGGKKGVTFQDLPADEDAKQLQTWLSRERNEEESTDLQFPDEVDTPQDIPARTRFQRYRGMRSFRTSPWDPYENLPRDYARIFQFEDFKRTERNVRRRADGMGIEPGTRVTVYLKGVPREAASQLTTPTVLFQLFQHEHKKSVLHFTVQRNTEYDGSVRSKDALILCIGPRRLRINPIFSQHTRGGGKGANNVHKFERFLKHGVTTVATTYGPVIFGNQSCALLRETGDPQSPELVAMGTFMNTDTTRVIAKRIVLTGHPFKVHKKTATVRYMLFNADDIAYFKPIALTTKHGRTGHIKESLGTHGYFKAHFDGPVNQMDTVCMALYKRVFPKWSEGWVAPGSAAIQVNGVGLRNGGGGEGVEDDRMVE